MLSSEEALKLTEEVISSYDQEIAATHQLIERGMELLDQSQLQQRRIRESLRERLASLGSLRYKDFDRILSPFLSYQERSEQEVKDLVRGFLGRQQEIIGKLARSLRLGLVEEVVRFKEELIHGIEEMKATLRRYQEVQGLTQELFRSLEGKREAVSASDLRKMIETIDKALVEEHLQQRAAG